MSAPVRFLGMCALVWVAFRAGAFWNPSAEDRAEGQPITALVPPAAAMPQPYPDAPIAAAPGYEHYPGYAGLAPQPPMPAYPAYTPVPVRIPIYYPAYLPQRSAPATPPPRPPLDLDFTTLAPVDDWSLATLPPSGGGAAALVSRPAPAPVQAPALPPRLDRLQLTSWALLRGPQSSPTLATGGMLGGSQAGARLTYAFDRRLAAQLRTSTPVGGGRGAEIALGARYQPLRSIPVWINAERRQAIGDYGRSAFAVFAEGGLYQQPMPFALSLDAYLQGGVVGFSRRDLFVDGAVTVSRPLFRNYSIGGGIWGGAQPGVYRLDAGPRLTMKVRNNIRVHADWRQRLLGKADPGSGPALTLAADF